MIRFFQLLAAEWEEAARIAAEQLHQHKVRSLLTALGVIIGIVAVTLMGTAIKGIDRGFTDSMDMIGQDMLYIQRFPWADPGDNWRMYRNRPYMMKEEAELLNRMIESNPESLLRLGVHSAFALRPIEYEEETVRGVQITGTNIDFAIVSSPDLLAGRFFTYAEEVSARNVIVLGYDIANALFPDNPAGAMNERVRIQGFPFTVIGVLERQGSFLGMQSFDRQAVVSLPAMRKFYGGNWRNSIRVQAMEGADMATASEELQGLYRRVRGLLPGEPDNFEINRSEALEAQFGPIKTGIALAGFFITGLALFVGAIGIMNITFVSVKERTREIGTRRAIGAPKRAILTQFLFEAVAVCLLGGSVGLLLAFGFKTAISSAFPSFPFAFSTDLVIMAFVLSVLTGIFSGLAPAYKAASLDPANALRHE